MKSSRIFFVFIIFYAGAALLAQEPTHGIGLGTYDAWLQAYSKRLHSSMPILNDSDKSELEGLLVAKPTFETGKFYGTWFEKCFKWYVDETGGMLDESRLEKMDYILAAMPDAANAGDYYPTYLKYVSRQILNWLPAIDDTRMTFLQYYKKIMPTPKTDAHYQLWLSEYGKLKAKTEEIGYDDQTIINFFVSLKPSQVNAAGRVFQINEETLLRWRNFMMNQQNLSAVNEIDSVLSGKK